MISSERNKATKNSLLCALQSQPVGMRSTEKLGSGFLHSPSASPNMRTGSIAIEERRRISRLCFVIHRRHELVPKHFLQHRTSIAPWMSPRRLWITSWNEYLKGHPQACNEACIPQVLPPSNPYSCSKDVCFISWLVRHRPSNVRYTSSQALTFLFINAFLPVTGSSSGSPASTPAW